MVDPKTWGEFRQTGLLLFVNNFLHIFGWAIVFHYDENKNITQVIPARVKFRGFDNKDVDKAHIALADHLKENIDELVKEVNL